MANLPCLFEKELESKLDDMNEFDYSPTKGSNIYCFESKKRKYREQMYNNMFEWSSKQGKVSQPSCACGFIKDQQNLC